MNVVVTGAAGFIGSHLCEALCASGVKVLGVDCLTDYSKAVATPRLVYASSSSVYGNATSYPTKETDLPHPNSPYGVTKLAAEHLCALYAANWALPTVSLRYFTVYGPRQRPDMAIRRLADCAVTGQPFALFGDGRQVRDFTYVSDVVNANIEAGFRDVAPGTVVNIAGGSHVAMTELIEIVEDVAGVPVAWERYSTEAGDVQKTGGTTEAAHRVLGWEPRVSLREGLTAQLEWSRARNPMSTVQAV